MGGDEMAKYSAGDTAWIVEWIPRTQVELDENGDHDPDQALACETRRVFATRAEAEDHCRTLLLIDADFYGRPTFGEYELIEADRWGRLPSGPRWELVGELRCIDD